MSNHFIEAYLYFLLISVFPRLLSAQEIRLDRNPPGFRLTNAATPFVTGLVAPMPQKKSGTQSGSDQADFNKTGKKTGE